MGRWPHSPGPCCTVDAMLNRFLPACLALATLSVGCSKPGPLSLEALQGKLDAKLQSAFVKNAAWITEASKAKEIAAKTGKLIFVYITRSYAP